jgi:DNA-binding CsgD family transcriptional regulator
MTSFTSSESINLEIQLLKKLGNDRPTRKQLHLASTLLRGVSIPFQVLFHPRLSEREKSCLLLAAKGKTAQQSADILDVKSTTIRTWHKKIKQKLACKTITQAVYEAIRYGYLPLYQEELKSTEKS